MNNVQMLWSLCAECVEFLSQMRSGAVLMESGHFFTHGRMHLEHHSCCCCLLPRLLGLPHNCEPPPPKHGKSMQYGGGFWWLFPCLQGFGGDGLTFPSLCAFFFFLSGDQLAHTIDTFFGVVRISPQWLSELTSCV